MYKERDLGINGLDYLIKNLGQGRALSINILDNVDLTKGRIVTFLPENAQITTNTNFRHGGILNFKISEKWIVDKLFNYLKQRGSIVIFEEILGSKSDGVSYKEPFCYFNDDLYKILDTPCKKKYILKCLKQFSSAYLDIIFLSYLRKSHFFLTKKTGELSAENLDLFRTNLQSFIISAFDGEGYLMWEANPLKF